MIINVCQISHYYKLVNVLKTCAVIKDTVKPSEVVSGKIQHIRLIK